MNKGDFTEFANDYMGDIDHHITSKFKLILSATGKDGSIVRAADAGAEPDIHKVFD